MVVVLVTHLGISIVCGCVSSLMVGYVMMAILYLCFLMCVVRVRWPVLFIFLKYV